MWHDRALIGPELVFHGNSANCKGKRHFAQMRKDLEAEWLARLEQQQQELAIKQQAMEEERRKMLDRQLRAVSLQRNAEFKEEVEEALKKRLVEAAATAAAAAVASASVSAPAAAVVESAPVVSVSKSIDPSISIDLTCPESAEMGSNMTVYWEYTRGRPSMSDWIGFFKKSRPEDSNSYYVYQKTGGSEKGKLEFVVPSKLGICEVRMFQNNSYKMVARSKPIRVGNDVTVEVTHMESAQRLIIKCIYGPRSSHSTWDWVGVYLAGETDNTAHGGLYTYLKSNEVSLPAPKRPGTYVVRYFQSGSGTSELAESKPFVLADNDDVSLIFDRSTGIAEVKWHIESVRNSSKDRIALFREGVFNPLMPLSVQLTHSTKPDGLAKFNLSSAALGPGRYQFVFIANGTTQAIKKSEPFELK